jgi:Rod binding domain-containing protein
MTVEASTGLPAIDQALEPAWVRHGSASTRKTYATALAFEAMLVQQLSQALTATSGLENESTQSGGAGSEAGSSPSMGASMLSSLLPQALSGGVMSAGGLGLAEQLTRELQSAQGAQQAQASGGTAPSAAAGSVPAATSSATGSVGA